MPVSFRGSIVHGGVTTSQSSPGGPGLAVDALWSMCSQSRALVFAFIFLFLFAPSSFWQALLLLLLTSSSWFACLSMSQGWESTRWREPGNVWPYHVVRIEYPEFRRCSDYALRLSLKSTVELYCFVRARSNAVHIETLTEEQRMAPVGLLVGCMCPEDHNSSISQCVTWTGGYTT